MTPVPFRARALVGLALLSAAISSLRAGLVWRAAEVERDAPYGAASIEIPFDFTVEGDVPVRILKIDTTCGCTVARSEKTLYAPGESGRIVAAFTPGQRQGLQEKHIRVTTDDRPEPQTLALRVKIRDLVTVERRHLIWERDEKPEPKRIRLTLQDDITLRIKPLAEAQARLLRIELLPGDTPAERILEMTPLAPAAPAIVPVTVHALRNEKIVTPLTFIARFNR